MTAAEIRSAVQRKRAAGNPGGKPRNVKTFARKKKKTIMHNDKVIKEVADALASGSKIHLAQSKMLRKILGSPVPRGKKNGSKKKKA